jgi:predicted ribosome quality control (RQC) complex YloA/Tae2 family protein
VSNAIRYDALLVHYLAAELQQRLQARRLRGVRLDSEARRLTLELDTERLVWELHPTRGWIRVVPTPTAEAGQEAIEGWGGRRVRTQRRPRVRRVLAPPDERILEIEIDGGGPDRATRFVVELMTNQWNVLALAPDRTILSALRTRDAGGRTLRAGEVYVPPARGPGDRAAREGADEPVSLERWCALLDGVAPDERERAVVRTLAWTSPLNAPSILGSAAVGPAGEALAGPGADSLTEAWQRYVALAQRPAANPHVLQLGRATPYPLPLPGIAGRPALSLLAAFEAAMGDGGSATLAPEVRAALEERLHRVRRRADRLHAEAEVGPAKAAALRRRADLLMAQLHRVSKGDVRITLDDFEGDTLILELDPALGPAENARALYDRARKRERAAARLPERVREAVVEGSRLESLISAMDAGRAEPAEVERWLAAVRPAEGSSEDTTRLPYRKFRSSGGLEIRVGRAGRANDELTFHHSTPDDIWLHARDTAGAHVILRWADRVQNPPQRDLLEAATLAALHSRARTSATVPVDWTRRKHVRKPRKASPGAVLPERVATLFVHPDPALVERLRVDG